MRSFLGLTVLLLALATPALAQTPDANWPADAKSGCKVWDQAPRPKETVTWSGQCANGVAQGQGVVQWYLDGAADERDEGEYRGGKLNGHGTITWPDGDRFDGEFRDGAYYGRGKYVWANGDRFEGEWRDDKPNGAGTKTTRDGTVYSGSWSNGCFKQGNRWATVYATAQECGFE